MATPADQFQNLHFAPQVQWPTDPAMMVRYKLLLRKIDIEAGKRGQTVDIISGYRPPDYNAKVGGAKNSNHTRAEAVDAYIDGKPIGQVWNAATFTRLGLRSGNQPNFFNGKPDPEHVDFGAPGGGATDTDTGSSPPPKAATSDGATGATTGTTGTATDLILGQDNSATIGPVVGPNSLVPNTGQAPTFNQGLPPRFDTWQLLAQLPGSSPDTMRMAQLAGQENDAQP